MISLLTVADPKDEYLSYFIDSVNKNLTIISEIIVCRTRMPPTFFRKNGKILEIGSSFHDNPPSDMSHEHAFGLHTILDLPPKNDHIFISDPDIIFYSAVDEFYYELMQKYNLNAVGVARNNPQMYVQDYFPAIFNILLKQSSLPKNFVKIEVEGVEYTDKFFAFDSFWRYTPPECFNHKKGWYDTGCLLYLWAKQNKWRWLSFMTGDVHNYSTQFYTSEPRIKDKLPRKQLLYHQSMSGQTESFPRYKEQYNA